MCNSDYYPMPRSSLHSVRKASYDVRSLNSDGTCKDSLLGLALILSFDMIKLLISSQEAFIVSFLICFLLFPFYSHSLGAVIRRQSLARLHSMAIEGPITKVISIISAAQESSPNYISQALDKVTNTLLWHSLKKKVYCYP